MITAKEGRPGSGKTHDAVKNDLIPALLLGRRVYSNIDGLQTSEAQLAWREVFGVTDEQIAGFRCLDNSEVLYFWDIVEPGSLIILDEVQRHFDSKEFMTESNKQFGKWASTHRHFGFDVVLISQKIGRIEKSVRDLIDFTYVFTKVRSLGSAAKKYYKCEFYSGPEIEGYPPLKTELRKYDRKIFPCYESYVNKVGEKFDIDKGFNVFKHPIFYAIPVTFCLFLYFAYQSSLAGEGIYGMIQAGVNGELPSVSAVSPLLDQPVAGSSVESVDSVVNDLSTEIPGLKSLPAVPDAVIPDPEPLKPVAYMNGIPIYRNGKGFGHAPM